MAADHGYYNVLKIERVSGEADLWLTRIEQDGEQKCALAGVIELASRFSDEEALAAQREVEACKVLLSEGRRIDKYGTKIVRMGCCSECKEARA